MLAIMTEIKNNADRRRTAPKGAETHHLTSADGKRLRLMTWPAYRDQSRGTVVILQGRREFIEKYFETVADLLDRGYAVAAVDWRGQGLSDRLLPDRNKGHSGDFADFVRDLAVAIDQIERLLPSPYRLLCHSMGGHIGLRYLHDHPGQISRAVFIAPMVGIHFGFLPQTLARTIVATARRFGWQDRFAPAQGPYTEANRAAEAGLLSSDPERLQDEIFFCRNNPDLGLGGVTYGWLGAALDSIALLRSSGFAEAITTPSLFVLAGADHVVANPDIRNFASRMPTAKITEIPDARHEVLKERDDIQAQFWAAFDRFMG